MKNYHPSTPSRRHLTVVTYSLLTKGARPLKGLSKRLKKHAGRNNQGRITVRHQGGGNKILYRLVDFKQDKFDIPAKLETLEYDPYRSAFIARVIFVDGERRYILAPQGLKIGDKIISSAETPLVVGNRTQLKRIPVGTFVYNVEVIKGRGGKLVRSAGSSAQVLANENGYTQIQLPSKETRKIPWDNYASLGQLSNPEHNLITIGKAGRSRWLNIRPTVSGSAMNPRDHPYGGGEGRSKRGTKRPKTKWGKITGGHRTRNKKKWSNKFIIKRRK